MPRPARTTIGLATSLLLIACSGSPQPFIQGDSSSLDRARDITLEHIHESSPELLSAVDDATLKRVTIDRLGQAHTVLTQRHEGVPVFGGEAIVHLNPDGSLRSFTDGFVPGVRVDTTPLVSAEDALAFVVDARGGFDSLTRPPSTDLQVLRHEAQAHLTWRVQLHQLGVPSMPVVFVDAHTGDEVWSYDNLAHAPLSDGDKETYDARNRKDYRGAVLADSSDPVANEAHINTGTSLSYYLLTHGRDSFDGSGTIARSYVHFDRDYVNAFWDGEKLTYGDGDGVVSGPLTVLDVVAHELTHGVTQHSADLIYANESGALNEATSDIMAAAVEASDSGATFEDIWWVGEDCWLERSALRYMNDPAAAGHYDYYPDRYTGTEDGGGVHWNSGIANLFFHLLSEGGTHPRGKTTNVVAGIGIENAADVWYLALTSYMTTGTSFAGARAATEAAAGDLNAAWVASVSDAWDAVGVAAPPSYQVTHTEAVNIPEGLTEQYGPFSGAGLEALRISVTGDTGDADLYVRKGAPPNTSTYDCRSASASSNEVCELNPAENADYYVMVHAWAQGRTHPGDVTGATLTVESALAEPECAVDLDCDDGTGCTDDTCSAGQCVNNDNGSCECLVDGDCTADTRVCIAATCLPDNTCDYVDDGTCCADDAGCSDLDTCTDDVCNADGTCSNPDNGTCGGATGDPCVDDGECNSGKCRTNGRWAGTCA
jgi:vibriolysin